MPLLGRTPNLFAAVVFTLKPTLSLEGLCNVRLVVTISLNGPKGREGGRKGGREGEREGGSVSPLLFPCNHWTDMMYTRSDMCQSYQ